MNVLKMILNITGSIIELTNETFEKLVIREDDVSGEYYGYLSTNKNVYKISQNGKFWNFWGEELSW